MNCDLPIFPGGGGVEYLNTIGLAALCKAVGLVSMAHTPEQQDKKQTLDARGVRLYVWENPNLYRREAPSPPIARGFRSVLQRAYSPLKGGPRRPRDTIIQDFQFRNLADPLLQALGEDAWNALVVVQSSCAHWLDYVPRFPVAVLVMHDVRALVYERRAMVERSLRKKFGYWLEALRYRRFERKYCRKYDLVVTVSADDEAWVRRHYKVSNLETVPIAVDGCYFAPNDDVPVVPGRIVFTGMMDHPPNADAARYFAEEVFPLVRARMPEAQFRVVGRNPTASVRALEKIPGVTVTGLVEDIRAELGAATVVVVPLRFGAGMRQKILEAWAMGKCVVSTRIGAEGLGVADERELLLADEPSTFAEAVVRAANDPVLRASLASCGRTLVKEKHDPDRIAAQYRHAVASVLRQRRQRGLMRVVIDLRWMKPGLAGGIENHTRSFLRELLGLDRDNCYTLLLPTESASVLDLRHHDNVRIVAMGGLRDAAELAAKSVGALRARLGFADWRSPAVQTLRRARRLNADIGLSMPGYIHPDLYPLVNVLVVPDIQHEYLPEFFSPHDLQERKRLYTDSIARAKHICANSEFTKRTLIERLSVPAEIISVTYLAADPIFSSMRSSAPSKEKIQQKYRLCDGAYLFYPANTWWHKNHLRLLEALVILRDEYHLRPLLVCTGGSREAQNEIQNAIRQQALEQQVRFLGYCPYEDLPGLYESAAALVYPSLFEGFGMPVLEAMSAACPVACSDAASLPEVAGDAALLFDPESPDEMAHVMSRVLADRGLRQELVARGCERSLRFSWLDYAMKVARAMNMVWEGRFD